MTLYTHKDKNIRKTWLYLTMFFIFVVVIGYVFSVAIGEVSILYGAVTVAIVMSVGSYWWSDKIVLSMSGAKIVTRENARDLYNVVENLCITAGLPVPKIYIIDDNALNAFATGRDPKHGVIVFTRGLLEKLDRSELEGVAAHELSHIGNRDILVSTVVVVLVGFVTLLADWMRHWTFWGGRDRSDRGGGQAQMIIFLVALVLSILAPIAALLMQLAISRKREFLADASGALLTRYPDGLASALQKISTDHQPLASANRATAHLFISNPFKGKKVSKLFMTHPPIEERIKALRGVDVKGDA